MKSLLEVAWTEVLHRNIPEDWSVKDRTSCEKTLHLEREDDIVKMVQMEVGKVQNDKSAHVREGATEPGQNGPGSVGPAHPRGGSAPVSWGEDESTLNTWRHYHSQRERAIRPRGHQQARERRGGRSFARRIALLEGSNHKWRRMSRPCQDTPGGEGRHRQKRHHDQRCYA
jgi:hypothetical protein